MPARWRGADVRVSEPGTGLVDARGHMEFQLVGSAFDAVVFVRFQEGFDGKTGRYA